MKKFLFLVLLIPLLANSATFPSKESARSGEYCKSEWTKRGQLNRQMHDYCMERENEGYAGALILMEKYKNQPWIQDVINFSIKNWTKAGVRRDMMVNHSMERIIDGWEDMVYESKQPGFNTAKHQSCQSKWGVRFDMVAHCYKN